jgi:hypothetical protein
VLKPRFSFFFVSGAGGVRIGFGVGGTVSATDLTKAIEVSDCVIEDGGHVHREGCGVLMQAAQDCVVTHNSIGNLYYTGVSMGWTWSYTLTGKEGRLRAWRRWSSFITTAFKAYHDARSLLRQWQQRSVLQ